MTDFLVIGGGIAGISAAARLSALGRVTVLERETALGYHASGRSAALFEQNYGKPSVIALNVASRGYLETAHGGVLSPRGLLLAGTADLADQFDRDRAAMSLDPLTLAEGFDRCPILRPGVIDRMAYSPDAFDIDTDRFLQNFVRDIPRGNGGQIVTRGRSHGNHPHRKRLAGLQTSARGLCGPDPRSTPPGPGSTRSAALAGIAPLGFTPLRRSMARIPAPSDPLPHGPWSLGRAKTGIFRPDAGALIVSPGEEHLCEPHDAFADDMVLAEGLARFEAHLLIVEVTRLLSNWAGLRTFSPDRGTGDRLRPGRSDLFLVRGSGRLWVSDRRRRQPACRRPGRRGQGRNRHDIAARLDPGRFA